MRSDPPSGVWRLLAPGIAVAAMYAACFATPLHRELRRVDREIRSKSTELADVEARLRTARLSRAQLAAEPSRFVTAAVEDPLNSNGETSQQEPFASAFARALEVFRSHGIDCTSSRSEDAAGGPSGAVVQRLELSGDFEDMLSAVDALAFQVPQAVPVGLSLRRPEPSRPCRWEFTLRFDGGSR